MEERHRHRQLAIEQSETLQLRPCRLEHGPLVAIQRQHPFHRLANGFDGGTLRRSEQAVIEPPPDEQRLARVAEGT